MTTKRDWNEAMNAWTTQICEDLGGCPTAAEAESFYDGTLPADEHDRMRARIVYCAGAPFPVQGEDVSDEQVQCSYEELIARFETS